MKEMRKRKQHILKPHTRTKYPSNLLFFDTETVPTKVRGQPHCERNRLLFGYAVAFRMEDNLAVNRTEQLFTSPETFFTFLESRLLPKTPLTCFAHNLPFDATIVDLWNTAYARGWQVTYLILQDPPNYIELSKDGCSCVFLDTFNYFKSKVKDLGKSIGILKLDTPHKIELTKECITYCRTDVEIIAESIRRLLVWLKENDLGSFGVSIASLALNTFRRKFMKHTIFIHDRQRICDLERRCYYGGLVNNFFIGTVKDKLIYKVDVNSLYPSVMLNTFPIKLVGEERQPSLSLLGNLLKTHCVCADVDVETYNRPYPKRHNDKLCEVIGKVSTSLCGPELLRAYTNKEIKRIHYLSYYEHAPIFISYINYFWQERSRHKRNDDESQSTFCKLMMNSLYGKFGQRSKEWVDINLWNVQQFLFKRGFIFEDEREHELNLTLPVNGEIIWIPNGTDVSIRVRVVNGYPTFNFGLGEHENAFPAIAAYVTSYAREKLRDLVDTAGARNVYYTDTDSLFVNQKGYDNLLRADCLSETELGKLKLEGKSKTTTFSCPKCYTFNGKRILKGIRDNAIQDGVNSFKQTQFEGVRSVIKRGAEPYIDIKIIRKTNTLAYNKGSKAPSGWTKPFELSDW